MIHINPFLKFTTRTIHQLSSQFWGPTIALGMLLMCALLLLGSGASEHTGVTGKDEYYLSLRTPLCMQEQQVWLVPCLDGQPRLRKPPMLYWITRASFEIFGANLASARLVAVSFGAMLVLGIAMLALELGDSLITALTAGFMALSCLGLAVGGRMLELDIPVATWSTWAWIWLLRWYRSQRPSTAIFGAICLAAGFLTKGPVVAVVCGAGVLALVATESQARVFCQQHWLQILGFTLLFMILALPWFIYVYIQYREVSTATLTTELASRQLLTFSSVPLHGALLLALPWGFTAIVRMLTLNSEPMPLRQSLRMRALWLGFTLLPFVFIRSFERYLFGSLVPLALLLALPLRITTPIWSAAARLGLAVTLPAAIIVQCLAIIIDGPGLWLTASIPVTSWFIYCWWQARHSTHMAISAAILWACVLGLAYPSLGINQVPSKLLAQGYKNSCGPRAAFSH